MFYETGFTKKSLRSFFRLLHELCCLYLLDQVLSVIFNKIFYESIKVIQKAMLSYHILFQNVICVRM